MHQLSLYKENNQPFISIKAAALWAKKYTGRNITSSNISYLIQYGKINKYSNSAGTLIKVQELQKYYDSFDLEKKWKKQLNRKVNWKLSFIEFKEKERTKHIHRLHPYKGKFIPQLAEYFLDSHKDQFKKESYFSKGDIVLDPFCGSGTTLVQANELGLHAVGIDISKFNTLISNIKISRHNISALKSALSKITGDLENFQKENNILIFDDHLTKEISQINAKHFPSPEFKIKLSKGKIKELKYALKKEKVFLSIYKKLLKKYKIKIHQKQNVHFMDKWFISSVREEINFILSQIKKIRDKDVKNVLALILSRTVRSCRATTHADLGTLKNPVFTPYYCRKHSKICKPLFTIKNWWKRYAKDTLNRLSQFNNLRTTTLQTCIAGDSRKVNLIKKIKNPKLAELLKKRKAQGIFSSPPYVGLIDYHEQHAYSYEMLKLKRKDKLEIGPLFKGQGKQARDSYTKGIAQVLKNCKKYMVKNYDVFLVANDKFNLYPKIAEQAGMKIINQFHRPVLNRVEKDRNGAYLETIFHLKEK